MSCCQASQDVSLVVRYDACSYVPQTDGERTAGDASSRQVQRGTAAPSGAAVIGRAPTGARVPRSGPQCASRPFVAPSRAVMVVVLAVAVACTVALLWKVATSRSATRRVEEDAACL
jgi:hypothetical protein